jgi:hypothetical protein
MRRSTVLSLPLQVVFPGLAVFVTSVIARYTRALPWLELKSRPRLCPVHLSGPWWNKQDTCIGPLKWPNEFRPREDGATTISITTLRKTMKNVTHGILTLSITTVGKCWLFFYIMLSVAMQSSHAECRYAERCYAECHCPVSLSGVSLCRMSISICWVSISRVRLSAVMLSPECCMPSVTIQIVIIRIVVCWVSWHGPSSIL